MDLYRNSGGSSTSYKEFRMRMNKCKYFLKIDTNKDSCLVALA